MPFAARLYLLRKSNNAFLLNINIYRSFSLAYTWPCVQAYYPIGMPMWPICAKPVLSYRDLIMLSTKPYYVVQAILTFPCFVLITCLWAYLWILCPAALVSKHPSLALPPPCNQKPIAPLFSKQTTRSALWSEKMSYDDLASFLLFLVQVNCSLAHLQFSCDILHL